MADGAELLEGRVRRGTRTSPAPRHPVAHQRLDSTAPAQGSRQVDHEESATIAPEEPAASRLPKRAERPVPRPDERLNNFSIRVRHTLDDHLGDLIYAFRKQGLKTSKTEMFELLLWELPPTADAALRQRIEEFRQRAPRV